MVLSCIIIDLICLILSFIVAVVLLTVVNMFQAKLVCKNKDVYVAEKKNTLWNYLVVV